MLQAYFVSDIHLGSLQDQRAQFFLGFLKKLNSQNCSDLFLMGDIFDLWIASHQQFIEKYKVIVTEIKRLTEEAVTVHYFEGNHDLYLKKFWQNEMGCKVYSSAQYIQLGPYHLRVEHGDEMDPDDRGYLFLRWFLRTSIMKFVAPRLPGSLVTAIGEAAAKKSRTYTSQTKLISDEGAIGKIRLHAEKAYAQQSYNYLFSGHVHVRDEYTVKNSKTQKAQSINLGTWLKEPGYYQLEESGGQWVSITKK